MGARWSKRPTVSEVRKLVPKLSDVRAELTRVLPSNAFTAGVMNIFMQYYIGLYLHTITDGDYPKLLHCVYELCSKTIYYHSYDNHPINPMYVIELGTMTYTTNYERVDRTSTTFLDFQERLTILWSVYGPTPRRPVPLPVWPNRTWWRYYCDERGFKFIDQDANPLARSLWIIVNNEQSEPDYDSLVQLDTHVFNTEWDSYCQQTKRTVLVLAIHRPTGWAVGLMNGGEGGICRVLDSRNRMRLIYAHHDRRKPAVLSDERSMRDLECRLESVHLNEMLTPICAPVQSDVKFEIGDWTMRASPIVDTVLMLGKQEARLLNINTGKSQVLSGPPPPLAYINFNKQIVFRGHMAAILCVQIDRDKLSIHDALMVIDFEQLKLWVQLLDPEYARCKSVQWQPI